MLDTEKMIIIGAAINQQKSLILLTSKRLNSCKDKAERKQIRFERKKLIREAALLEEKRHKVLFA